jgi:hypothetical protein
VVKAAQPVIELAREAYRKARDADRLARQIVDDATAAAAEMNELALALGMTELPLDIPIGCDNATIVPALGVEAMVGAARKQIESDRNADGEHLNYRMPRWVGGN